MLRDESNRYFRRIPCMETQDTEVDMEWEQNFNADDIRGAAIKRLRVRHMPCVSREGGDTDTRSCSEASLKPAIWIPRPNMLTEGSR